MPPDHPMHFVQQFREFLDLVTDHKGGFVRQRLADQRLAAREPQPARLTAQVVYRAPGKPRPEQRGPRRKSTPRCLRQPPSG